MGALRQLGPLAREGGQKPGGQPPRMAAAPFKTMVLRAVLKSAAWSAGILLVLADLNILRVFIQVFRQHGWEGVAMWARVYFHRPQFEGLGESLPSRLAGWNGVD